MKTLLIIGNGSTGKNIKNNQYYINNHTGRFLEKLSKIYKVGFSQFTSRYNENSNLQNFNISKSSILNHNLPNKKHPFFIIKIVALILKYDFIYIFYPGSLGTLFGIIAKILNKPYGLYVRGENFNRNSMDKRVLSSSKFILTISPSFVPKLNKYCNSVEVIKPMISINKNDLFYNRDYKTEKIKKILFVGRVEESKGIYELLEISKILKLNNYKFKLDIVGGGDLYFEVKELLKKENLTSEIELHGQISDKKKLKAMYDNASIFLFTSHHEGFPRVLYEAMASGLPIFTTFVGGISGRMKDFDNCIQIPVKDSKATSKVILKHLNDIETLKKIGEKGIDTISELLNSKLLSHEQLMFEKLNYEK